MGRLRELLGPRPSRTAGARCRKRRTVVKFTAPGGLVQAGGRRFGHPLEFVSVPRQFRKRFQKPLFGGRILYDFRYRFGVTFGSFWDRARSTTDMQDPLGQGPFGAPPGGTCSDLFCMRECVTVVNFTAHRRPNRVPGSGPLGTLGQSQVALGTPPKGTPSGHQSGIDSEVILETRAGSLSGRLWAPRGRWSKSAPA